MNMSDTDKFFLWVLLFILVLSSGVLATAIFMPVRDPVVHTEFSPSEGVTCVKTSSGVGCWRDGQ